MVRSFQSSEHSVVRIGLELFGTQSAGRDRGVGRYVRNLAAALAAIAQGRGHELVLYAEHGKPTDLVPVGPNAPLKRLRPEPTLRDTVARLVDENPDGLDALLFLNPLELMPGFDIPSRPVGGGRSPCLAAVVYDLIPLLMPEGYLHRWPTALVQRYRLALQRLETYPRLLTISETTRADVLLRLDATPERVVTIGAAGDDRSLAFTPATPDDGPSDEAALDRLGMRPDRPFILALGASDPRKNLEGLVDAIVWLPEPIRQAHALVIAGSISPEARTRLSSARGIDILLTGPVDDRTLRALYRRCAVFAFPSRYEGFGLPLLEALGCGAVVVAGRNSSQPEVVGNAAVLVNTSDPSALAEGLTRALSDAPLARALRDAGRARARLFSWDSVATRTLRALEEARAERGDVLARSTTRIRPKQPRVALISPLPPNRSGIADHVGRLVPALAEHLTLDLFHEPGALPFARFREDRFGGRCHDARLFDRLHRLQPYDAIVYQMGNSPAHLHVHDLLLRHPGVVVLHDLSLASFHYQRTLRGEPDAFVEELIHAHPHDVTAFGDLSRRWREEPERLVNDLNRAGLDMNRRILDQARALIVHSVGAATRAARVGVGIAGKTFVIPLGAEPVPRPAHPADRSEARTRLGLPIDALIVGQFGVVHPSKLNAEAVEAFQVVVEARPEAMLLIVGEEADGGAARRRARDLGLSERVRFWGRPDDDEFQRLVTAVDLAVCLRRPPTLGETSGALLHLLRAGVATIVTDTGSFSEFPRDVVRKVAWKIGDDPATRGENLLAFRRALASLSGEPVARSALGRAAWEHVRATHAFSRVASLYSDAIASCAERSLRHRGPHWDLAGHERPARLSIRPNQARGVDS